MKLRSLLAATTFCLLATSAKAQTNEMTLYVQPADTAGMQVFVYAMDNDDSFAPMSQDGLSLKQEIQKSELGLYKLVYVSTTLQAQYATPIFLDGTLPAAMNMQLVDGCPKLSVPTGKKKAEKVQAAETNRLLEATFAFNQVYYKLSRDVWTKAQSMSADELRQMLKSYDEAQTALASDAAMTDSQKKYLDIWTYLLKSECVTVYNRYHTDAPLKMADELHCSAAQKLDDPIALLHGSALSTAQQDLPKGTLNTRLDYINANYKCEDIKSGLQRLVADAFIRGYKFDKGYQDGLSILQEACDKQGLPTSYLDKFKERIAAVPGSAFPDVALIDSEGNPVSLDKFKGKYVYIDLWASWCVPCIKEVPYLQEMEKQLQNPNVVFVSISTDSTEKPWRSRMEQQKMHGNQWLNTDGKLCDKLNVSGIPHFLIYDKEGHMLVYDAPRPSTGDQLKTFLEGLK